MWSTSQVDTHALIPPIEVVFGDSNSSMSYDECVPVYTNLEGASSLPGCSPDSGYEDNSPSVGATLVIEEEPETSYRFRYMKESLKPHGPLKGQYSEGNTPKNSSGPKVKLENFQGEAIIRAWLFEGSLEGGPSPHRLLHTKNKEIEDEPHDVIVNSNNNYTACFDKLNIVHVVRSEEEYQRCYLRKKAGLAKRVGDKLVKNIPKGPHTINAKSVKEEWKKKNTDIATLYFEAFEKRGDEYYYVANAISRPIKNKKSPKTNDLKIVRSSHCEGTVNGGDTVLIFTEKMVKDIRIVFTDDEGWTGFAIFDEKDIHKQVAVAFKTPPYKNLEITEPVTVSYHIERTTDRAESLPFTFRYLPARSYAPDIQPPKRKRTGPGICYVVPSEESPMFVDETGTRRDPMFAVGDPELVNELLQYDSIPVAQMSDDFGDVDSGDLLQDNLPSHELAAYHDWCKDSTPAARGVLRSEAASKAGGPPKMPAFERARRLHISILRENVNDFAKYLSCDTVNYKISSKTPLHVAVEHERADMVNKLLGAKADIYALDGVSNTPVHTAIVSSISSLEILMTSATPPSSVFNKDGDDPVLFAIRKGNLGAVKRLLKKGFSIDSSNIKDKDGALHLAVQISDQKIRFDMVSLLLKHEASVSRRNGAGMTALDLANANPQPEGLIEKLSQRLSEESCDENEADDDSGDNELTQKLDSLSLGRLEEDEESLGSSRTDASGSAAEPYLALDGDVDTSKKVADLMHCAFLKPTLVAAQKQSQVLLTQLERKMSPAEAVKTLNDAYARAKGL